MKLLWLQEARSRARNAGPPPVAMLQIAGVPCEVALLHAHYGFKSVVGIVAGQCPNKVVQMEVHFFRQFHKSFYSASTETVLGCRYVTKTIQGEAWSLNDL